MSNARTPMDQRRAIALAILTEILRQSDECPRPGDPEIHDYLDYGETNMFLVADAAIAAVDIARRAQ